MKYFDLLDDMTIAGRWHLGEVRSRSGTEPPLWHGVRLVDTSELRGVVTHRGRALDFSLTAYAVPIVSNKLAGVIAASAPGDVQCVPVELAGRTGMFVLNSLRVIRCLDESSSDFLKWTKQDHRADLAGQYRQVTKLSVDPRAIPSGAHLFRIEAWRVALIVSEHVKSAMEAAGCIGAKFIDVTPLTN